MNLTYPRVCVSVIICKFKVQNCPIKFIGCGISRPHSVSSTKLQKCRQQMTEHKIPIHLILKHNITVQEHKVNIQWFLYSERTFMTGGASKSHIRRRHQQQTCYSSILLTFFCLTCTTSFFLRAHTTQNQIQLGENEVASLKQWREWSWTWMCRKTVWLTLCSVDPSPWIFRSNPENASKYSVMTQTSTTL